MKTEEINMIEQSCIRLLTAFSTLNDANEHEAMVELFTENGSFARPSDPDVYTIGREDILVAFKARPQGRVTRHLLSNILIDVKDASNAKGRCNVLLYTASSDNKAPVFGLQADPSQLLGEFDADFKKVDGSWEIARLSGEIIMTIGGS